MKSLLAEKFRAVFGRSPEILAYAPGRIEFIGNHTDYNGGTVLGAAIDRGVWVAVAEVGGWWAGSVCGAHTSASATPIIP